MHISPLFMPKRPFMCQECETPQPGSTRARWRFDGSDKQLICARHVSPAEWSDQLRAGAGLRWPLGQRRVGPIEFDFHWEDYDQTYMPGRPGADPPEDDYDESEGVASDRSEEGVNLVAAA